MRHLLHRHAGAGKHVLRINCGETNIQRAQQASRGLAVAPLRGAGPALIPEGPDGRGSASHLVFVCDDPLEQPLLRQVIVGNERMLRLCGLRILEPDIPPECLRGSPEKTTTASRSGAEVSVVRSQHMHNPYVKIHSVLLVAGCRRSGARGAPPLRDGVSPLPSRQHGATSWFSRGSAAGPLDSCPVAPQQERDQMASCSGLQRSKSSTRGM